MKHPIRMILLLAVVALAATAFKCDKKNDGVFRGTMYENYTEFTPKGVRVMSRQRINKALFASIDAGLSDTFRIASNPPNNYTLYRTFSDYNVWLFPRSNRCIAAGFLVDATGSPYEGSEYDKNPDPDKCEICAAGMTIFSGGVLGDPARPGMIVVDDPGMIKAAVKAESEHSVLFYSDRHRYTATMYHPPPHPIMTDGSALAKQDEPFDAVSANVGDKQFCVLVTK